MINKPHSMNINTSIVQGSGITQTVMDLNKKVAEKLKQNANLILREFEELGRKEENLLKSDDTNVDKSKRNNKIESSEPLENFKIELSLRDEENELNDKKKEKNEEIILDITQSDLESVSASKKRCTEENNVNKLFYKTKWNQVNTQGHTNQTGKRIELVSNDGIYLNVKNQESFVTKTEQSSNIINNIDAENSVSNKTSERKIAKKEKEDKSDSDLDIDIPDII